MFVFIFILQFSTNDILQDYFFGLVKKYMVKRCFIDIMMIVAIIIIKPMYYAMNYICNASYLDVLFNTKRKNPIWHSCMVVQFTKWYIVTLFKCILKGIDERKVIYAEAIVMGVDTTCISNMFSYLQIK